MLLSSKRFISIVAWSITVFLTYHTVFVTMPCVHGDDARCSFGRVDEGPAAIPVLSED